VGPGAGLEVLKKKNNLAPTGIRTPAVQPKAGHCMDYMTPAPEALIIKVTLSYRLELFRISVTN
jgi:hypothetical protein